MSVAIARNRLRGEGSVGFANIAASVYRSASSAILGMDLLRIHGLAGICACDVEMYTPAVNVLDWIPGQIILCSDSDQLIPTRLESSSLVVVIGELGTPVGP